MNTPPGGGVDNSLATLSCVNFSGYVRYVTIFSRTLATACCLVLGLGLGLGLGLDLVSGWLVVLHSYLYYFLLSLSHCLSRVANSWCRN